MDSGLGRKAIQWLGVLAAWTNHHNTEMHVVEPRLETVLTLFALQLLQAFPDSWSSTKSMVGGLTTMTGPLPQPKFVAVRSLPLQPFLCAGLVLFILSCVPSPASPWTQAFGRSSGTKFDRKGSRHCRRRASIPLQHACVTQNLVTGAGKKVSLQSPR